MSLGPSYRGKWERTSKHCSDDFSLNDVRKLKTWNSLHCFSAYLSFLPLFFFFWSHHPFLLFSSLSQQCFPYVTVESHPYQIAVLFCNLQMKSLTYHHFGIQKWPLSFSVPLSIPCSNNPWTMPHQPLSINKTSFFHICFFSYLY